MVAWLYVLVGLAFAGFVGAALWLVALIFKEKNPEQDAPIILNFLTKHSKGRMLGVIKSVQDTRNNRQIIEYDARDVDLNRVIREKEDTTAKVILPKNKILTFPKGTLSSDRNVQVALPINGEDLHPAVRDTPLGAGLLMATELKNYEMLVEKVLREGTNRRDYLAEEIGDGELSRAWSMQFMEKVQDFMNATINTKLKEKNSAYPSPISGAQFSQ